MTVDNISENEAVREVAWSEPCPGKGHLYLYRDSDQHVMTCQCGKQFPELAGLQPQPGGFYELPPHERTEEAALVWVQSGCSCGGVFVTSPRELTNPYNEEILASINVQARLDDLEGKVEHLIDIVERLVENLEARDG